MMCEECSKELMIDERGDHVCEDCGAVHELPSLATENNSTQQWAMAAKAKQVLSALYLVR